MYFEITEKQLAGNKFIFSYFVLEKALERIRNQTESTEKEALEMVRHYLSKQETFLQMGKSRAIKLLKDVRFPYSGKSYVIFPKGSEGHVAFLSSIKSVPTEEYKLVAKICEEQGKVPATIEGELIALSLDDYYLEEEQSAST